jgi:hypothetical protein
MFRKNVVRGLMSAVVLALLIALLSPSLAFGQDGDLEMLEQFWLDTYGDAGASELLPPSPTLPRHLLAKAPPDECFCGVGQPYPTFHPYSQACDPCNGEPARLKVNQAYVWGLAKSGNDLWFGTMANTHCHVLGGLLSWLLSPNPPPPIETDSWVCEYGASQYSPPRPPVGGDWRPPRIYLYDMLNEALTELTPGDPLILDTSGIRSAGTLDNVVFLAGPSLGDGINVFAFRADTRTYLGSTNLASYDNIRQWVVADGVLYAGVEKAGDGGAVIRWRGDIGNPFEFENVGDLDADAANLALHEGRLFVSSWPARLYMSPPIPPWGLTSSHAGGWVEVWHASDYEPDPVTAATYGGGALVSFGGYLFWGTMHVPFMSTLAHFTYPYPNPPTDLAETFLGSWRPISIFRGRDFGEAMEQIDLLYGAQFLPVYNGFAWQILPNNMGGAAPLWGSSGFGNFYNNYTWIMAVYGDQLFVGTMDASYLVEGMLTEVQEELSASEPATILQLPPNPEEYVVGGDLLRFTSVEAPAVAEDDAGVENWANYGIRTVVSDDFLYLGMANPMNLMTDTSDDLPEGGWELLCLGECEVEAEMEFVPEVEFVPEPGSVALLGSGLVGLAGYAGLRWRARRKE